LTREKFNVRVNWNHVSRQPQQLVAPGLSIEPDARSYRAARDSVDLSGEYNLTRQLSLYANFRTSGGQVQDLERYGSSTPAHARLQRRISYGFLWTFGLRGSF